MSIHWSVLSLNLPSYLPEDKRIEQLEKARNNNILLVSALLAPLAPLATIGVAWLTIRNSQRTTKDTLALTYQGQVADRFTKATEMLSGDEPYSHIAGIHSLQQISETNYSYLSAAIEVLAAFVRVHAKKSINQEETETGIDKNSGCPTSDVVRFRAERFQTPVQAAMTNLFKLRQLFISKNPVLEKNTGYVSLNHLDLKFLLIESVQLNRFLFINSDLRGAYFSSVQLINVAFRSADLRGAIFDKTTFNADVSLYGADLTNVNLSTAISLTWEQLLRAKSRGGTKLPSYLLDPNAPSMPKDFDLDLYKQEKGWGNLPKSEPKSKTHQSELAQDAASTATVIALKLAQYLLTKS